MSLQSLLTKQAFEMLPKVLNAIEAANDFESNQMACYAERKINDSKIALVEMTNEQIDEFQNELLETFKFKEWL